MKLAVVVIAFLLLAVLAASAQTVPIAASGQYGVSITSVTTLTVPNGASVAEICVVSSAANYRTDGTTPTTAAGGGIPVIGGSGCFPLGGYASLVAFKVIGAAGAVMSVEYFR